MQATKEGRRERLCLGNEHGRGRTGRKGGRGTVRANDCEGEYDLEFDGVAKGSEYAAPTTNAFAKAGMAR